jgi:hypothetical protein
MDLATKGYTNKGPNNMGKLAQEHACLPLGNKLNQDKYIKTAYVCDMSNAPAQSAVNFNKPIVGKSTDNNDCCSLPDCAKPPPPGGWNNHKCSQMSLNPNEKHAQPFIDIYSDPKKHGYLNNADAIKTAMKNISPSPGNYSGYASKNNVSFIENYSLGATPSSSELTLQYPTRNISHLLLANLTNTNPDPNPWADVSTSVLPGVRWYWPVKGYGIFTFLGNTHAVATKYGFLMEGSSSDPRPSSRKMTTINGTSVPVGGGIPIDYFCTAGIKPTGTLKYYSMNTPGVVSDGTNTANFPTPYSPTDLSTYSSKYSADTIYGDMSSTGDWLDNRVFRGSDPQSWRALGASFILPKQVNDLYAAVGNHTGGFIGYPESGNKLTFDQCKQMVTLFNITGMIPRKGLKGCNTVALQDMSNEVWMAQFSDGTTNNNYNSKKAVNYIAVSEWEFPSTAGGKPEMFGCMYDWSMTTSDGGNGNLTPTWDAKSKTLVWKQLSTTGDDSGIQNNAWPVGAFFILDQINRECQSFLTAISADRQYNTLQITASLQGLYQPSQNCAITNPYSPEILKILCNKEDADWSDTPTISGCFNPYNKVNTPSAGTWFSPKDSNGDHIVRIPSEYGQYTAPGVGKYIDAEGDVNFIRDGNGKLSNYPNIKNPYDVCGSSYLLDPFEDLENYIFSGFVRADIINANSKAFMTITNKGLSDWGKCCARRS